MPNRFGFASELSESKVLVDGSGNGSITVRFGERGFCNPPALMLVDNRADVAAGATYTASNVTRTGFTLTVASSQVVNEFVPIRWAAVEKG